MFQYLKYSHLNLLSHKINRNPKKGLILPYLSQSVNCDKAAKGTQKQLCPGNLTLNNELQPIKSGSYCLEKLDSSISDQILYLDSGLPHHTSFFS